MKRMLFSFFIPSLFLFFLFTSLLEGSDASSEIIYEPSSLFSFEHASSSTHPQHATSESPPPAALPLPSSSPSSVLHPKKEQSSREKEHKISNWEARLELARVLSYLKKYDESVQEYLKLLQKKPNSAIARREYASVLFYLNKIDESLQEFSKVPPSELDDKSLIVLADLYSKKKMYPNAEYIYIEHLKKTPKDDKVRLKLAALLSWQKKYDESIYHYRILLNRLPNDIQIRRHYAQVLTWMGNEEEAIAEWKKTLP